MKILISLAALFFFAFTAYGPAVLADNYQADFNQTYDLAYGGTVSVKNINGSLTVHAWDQAKVQITARKSGEAKSDVGEVNVEVNQEPNRLSIRTVPSKGGDHGDGVSVSLNLMVPRNVLLDKIESVNGSIEISGITGSINTNTVNGSIKIQNSSGSANAKTVNGAITVELSRVEANKDMKFATVNGSIKAYLQENINAEVRAKTMNGGLQTDFPLPIQSKLNSKSITGTLGHGGPLLTLEAVNGAISLLKSKSGI